MSTPLLQVHGLRKEFGATVALDAVTLSVASGEIVAIIGPSGSGKSTLIRCVHMLETYDAGSIWLGDEQLGYERVGSSLRARGTKDVARQRARMGMVFQNFNLFPHRSVLQNIAEAPIHVAGASRAQSIAEAKRLLAVVGLSAKADAYPRHLSGGQQQRVAIARSLAMSPELLLFDEPTSALDPETVGDVLAVMREIATTGSTMMVVTHEIQFAREIADRIIFMEAGRIVEAGSPTELLDDPSPRLTSFLRQAEAA